LKSIRHIFFVNIVFALLICPCSILLRGQNGVMMKESLSDSRLIHLSQEFLYKVRSEEEESVIKKLKEITTEQLVTGLAGDADKMLFWINLYNGWFQVLAKNQEIKGKQIFKVKGIPFADRSFSLDEIEHGILRRYRWKYSMGYMSSWFPPSIIKELAVDAVDYRVHFALNCGAKSCPPILFYSPERFELQLNLAMKNFIKSETRIDTLNQIIYTSRIFSWFRGDFNGKKGILKLLGDVWQQDFSTYKIKFDAYDWSKKLGYYGP
jgi:hypothetical protein